MTAEQCRKARAMLGWSRIRLEGMTNVSDTVIRRIEDGFPVKPHLRAAVLSAFRAAGVEFLPKDGGFGVQLQLQEPR